MWLSNIKISLKCVLNEYIIYYTRNDGNCGFDYNDGFGCKFKRGWRLRCRHRVVIDVVVDVHVNVAARVTVVDDVED